LAVLVLAEAHGEIAGTVLGAFDGWRGNMYRLVVHPRHRRQGIARRLVRQVEQVFATWGVQRMTVLIEVDRPWATAFWTAAGYPRDDRIVRHVGTLTAPTAV
jgi:GNAT superfamily N-acetyltransferase